MKLALVALVLLSPAAAADGDSPAVSVDSAATPSGLGALRSRAVERAAADGDGVAALAAQAASGGPLARRAALEALGALPEGGAPEAAVAPAIRSLSSADPEERAAALRALLACGAPARTALDALAAPPAPGATAPAEPVRRRAAEALESFARRDVEREFLSLWTPEDGQYRGMYAPLKRHGTLGGRVLCAIALDRRMAGSALLGHGPYAWIHAPDPTRERAELRDRALTALEDAGDPSLVVHLRSVLRTTPADELFDDLDTDPVPAGLDDAVRRVLACLGEPEWILETIRVSEEAAGPFRGPWSQAIELRRQASAHGTLGESLADPEARRRHEDLCVGALQASMDQKRRHGLSVDGVEYYNLACALARRNRAPEDRLRALACLSTSVKTYAVTADWLARDGDLANLHGEKRFADLVAELRAKELGLEQKLDEKK